MDILQDFTWVCAIIFFLLKSVLFELPAEGGGGGRDGDNRGNSFPRKHAPTLEEHRSTKSLNPTGNSYVMWHVPPEVLM